MSLCACGARLAPIGVQAPAGLTMCATCAPTITMPADAAFSQNIITGAAVGFIAAIAATAAWYFIVTTTLYQMSLIAIGVGWLVGHAVVLGGRGRGAKLQAVAIGLTLLSMAAAEYLIDVHFHNVFYAAQDIPTVSPIQPVSAMVSIVRDALVADPMTLLFWLLAMAVAFRVAGVPRATETR